MFIQFTFWLEFVTLSTARIKQTETHIKHTHVRHLDVGKVAHDEAVEPNEGQIGSRCQRLADKLCWDE